MFVAGASEAGRAHQAVSASLQRVAAVTAFQEKHYQGCLVQDHESRVVADAAPGKVFGNWHTHSLLGVGRSAAVSFFLWGGVGTAVELLLASRLRFGPEDLLTLWVLFDVLGLVSVFRMVMCLVALVKVWGAELLLACPAESGWVLAMLVCLVTSVRI